MMSRSDSSQRSLPTVVVARKVKKGREREFERWVRRLVAVAAEAPGHAGADVQAPNKQHPAGWVIVYQFESQDKLDNWLGSPQRHRLMNEGASLIEGHAREQKIALSPETEPVTVVASFRMKEGNEQELGQFYSRLLASLSEFSGFLRCELFEPVEGIQEETVIMFSFGSRTQLDAWLASDERKHVLATIDPLLMGDRTVNVVGGFGGWFGNAGTAQVKRWKQASIVLLALFPTSLTLTFLRQTFLPNLNFPVGVLLGNAAGVGILSWLLMPRLTRFFDNWLRQ